MVQERRCPLSSCSSGAPSLTHRKAHPFSTPPGARLEECQDGEEDLDCDASLPVSCRGRRNERGLWAGATRPTSRVGRQGSHTGEHMSHQRPHSEVLAWTRPHGPGHRLPLHCLGPQEPLLPGMSRAANKGTFAHHFLSQAAPLREV